jgi:uncharacterized protein YceK
MLEYQIIVIKGCSKVYQYIQTKETKYYVIKYNIDSIN